LLMKFLESSENTTLKLNYIMSMLVKMLSK